jgi:hypothetical protein
MTMSEAAKIAALNDHARQTFTGCRVLITQGVQAIDDLASVLDRVRKFDRFTPHNDPYGEHDFGAFHHGDNQIFWRFDYYDLDLTMHSADPGNPEITARVLIIMLAEEY